MKSFTQLKLVSAELTRGLQRCHLLIEDARAHLTPANSNEAPFMLPATKREDEGRG